MKRILIALVACICIVSVGCAGGAKKPADLPKLNPTTIKIVYDDGTPVDNAQVALRLAKSTGGRVWNLTGVSDATGSLTLKTDGQWDGAPVGSYQVMVTKEVGETAPTDDASVPSVKRYVAKKYNDPNASGLTVEIVEGSNTFELKVGEKVEEEVAVAN